LCRQKPFGLLAEYPTSAREAFPAFEDQTKRLVGVYCGEVKGRKKIQKKSKKDLLSEVESSNCCRKVVSRKMSTIGGAWA
jgi:hypothetical protein